MKAIQTKYLRATNCRGSRIVASDEDGNKIIMPWNSAYNTFNNHQIAAVKLCKKMGWPGTLQTGGIGNTYMHCFIDKDRQIKIGRQ